MQIDARRSRHPEAENTQTHRGSITRNQTTEEELLQLGVFGLCGEEDGNVRIGIFPGGKEILVGVAGFRGIALKNERARARAAREDTIR